MTTGKEEKKEEKGKEKMAGKEEEKKEKKENIEVITAVYKLNLHCQECGHKIKKHLMITQGVQNVDIDVEKGEIKAKGKLDPLKILKLIEKKSKKKVELISPKIKVQEKITTVEKPKETKDPIVRTITVKVHMHCDKCEADLRKRLIKHKGIFSVNTDKKAETVTIEGTIEQEKLISFLRKRVHKNAEVISIKEEKKEEKKEKGKEEEGKSSKPATKDKDGDKSGESTKEKGEGKSGEATKEKGEGKSGEKPKEKGEGKSGEATKEKGEGKSGETTKIIEAPRDTKDEIKVKDNVPYIIHYVYAPQIFSDENPNSCSIL